MISVSVVSAKQWGAKPARSPRRLSNPSFIIIHHTATKPGLKPSLEQAKALARAIQSDHQNNRGWIDSGHNFLVSAGGFILEGRTGSVDAVERGRCVVSAHTVGANSSPGIENEGKFMLSTMSDKQWISLVKLCTDICELCHLKPTAIKGHRDFNATLCPGDHLYSRLPELRIAVSAQLAARKKGANSKPA